MAFNRAAGSALYPPKAATTTYSYDGVKNDISIKNFFSEGSKL